MPITRREFLQRSAAVGLGLGALGAGVPGADARTLPGGSILDLPARDAPIDTIVVLMMENRSFDHYLGWLGTDDAFLDTGRSRYGRSFRVNASTDEHYPAPDGRTVATYPLIGAPSQTNPHRGCGFGDPGHSWTQGRAQRDGGFLATGSRNDEFALGYFRADDLPFYAALTRRFTTFDRYHCSLLGPTFPNREYLHSAQSGGIMNNALPPQAGYPDGFTWPTIWDRFQAANVPARYYYVDLPVIALWGARLVPFISPLANYFDDAAAGRLPNVVFLDPGFTTELRTDEHPHGDVRDGQRLVYNCIKAFVESPHWQRGAFILTYDEWGGFFDHVAPPRLRDDRASRDDADDFAQAGFRVPTRLLSPYARPGFVDHRLYDHASILRFLEWRFLGAPARGHGRGRDPWFLTRRDRFANNLGASLRPDQPEPDFDLLPAADPATSPACGSASAAAVPQRHDLERALDDGFFEQMGYRIDLRPLPVR